MSVKNGIISAPISVAEVAQTLGVSVMDVGYLCSNAHGKTNRYSWIKPVNEAGLAQISQSSALNYVKHVKLKTYTLGDAVPTTALADYDAPIGGSSSPYRLTDFDGYDHSQYPDTVDLSSISGTTLDPDTGRSFPITRNDNRTGISLFEYLINGEKIVSTGNTSTSYWYFGILIVAKYGSDTRYILTGYSYWAFNSISISAISGPANIRKVLADIDISKYTCTVFAVAWLYNTDMATELAKGSPWFTKMLDPATKYKFFLYPQVGAINPLATNVKFTKPKDRVSFTIVVVEYGELPDDYEIQSYTTQVYQGATTHPATDTQLYLQGREDFFYGFDGTPIYSTRGWRIFSREYYIDSNPLTFALQINCDKRKLELQSFGNYSKSTDDGQAVLFEWNATNLKNYINQDFYFYLGIGLFDPNDRRD